MRRSLPFLCLLTVLLSACSTVRVTPEGRPRTQERAPGAASAPVREDRANTGDFPPGEDGYRPPARLAVLLPMSGTLASAGQSVRDGFLAAYYAESRARPVVQFYDSQGNAAGAQAALSKALADGAQMIVGPLAREEVNAVLGQAGGLPTLALNRGSRPPPAGSASFALLPEDEGADAAQRLADRRLLQVLVVANRSDSAQRSVAAFRAALAERGGTIAGEVPVSAELPDLGPQLAGFQAASAPPQAVFFAVDAGQARAIAAQLKASPLAALPRISTSQILNGASARSDAELDGIEFPEMPWLLGQPVGLPDAAALARSLPGARGGGQRLFAFGADAWRVVAYYERLYNDPAYSVRGATGELQVSVQGQVRRLPSWAVFSGGRGRAAPAPAAAAANPAGGGAKR
jgi:hypothetical protein